MDILKKKRATLKGSLTRIANFADEIVDELPKFQVQSRLEALQAMMVSFNDLCNVWYTHSGDPGYEDPETFYGEFEEKYLDAKSKLLAALDVRTPGTSGIGNTDNSADIFSKFLEQQGSLFEQLRNSTILANNQSANASHSRVIAGEMPRFFKNRCNFFIKVKQTLIFKKT